MPPGLQGGGEGGGGTWSVFLGHFFRPFGQSSGLRTWWLASVPTAGKPWEPNRVGPSPVF